MDTIALARIVGVVFLSIIFVVTVVLMPRIFGVNAPSPSADEPAAGRTPRDTVPVRPTAVPPVPESVLKS
jgi:hypothetical protein